MPRDHAANRLAAGLLTLFLASCGDEPAKVLVDGSSTVYPISEAVAEEFRAERSDVQVSIGVSGTGGGFKKFCAGEIDVNDASRPISAGEIEKAKAAGIEFVELPIAYDGLAVLVHPKNGWVDHLTMAELKKIWEPSSTVKKWSDVRAGFPDRPIVLYGPGPDSGTFDYFTEAVVGKAKSCRPDYTPSENDNVLVRGIEGDEDALGYFGYAYYAENKDRLKLVPIAAGAGPVLPEARAIEDGTYPLARPLFLYVGLKSLERPEVQQFMAFYLDRGPELAAEVGYVALPAEVSDLARQRLEGRVTGSVYAGREGTAGARLQDLFGTK